MSVVVRKAGREPVAFANDAAGRAAARLWVMSTRLEKFLTAELSDPDPQVLLDMVNRMRGCVVGKG